TTTTGKASGMTSFGCYPKLGITCVMRSTELSQLVDWDGEVSAGIPLLLVQRGVGIITVASRNESRREKRAGLRGGRPATVFSSRFMHSRFMARSAWT